MISMKLSKTLNRRTTKAGNASRSYIDFDAKTQHNEKRRLGKQKNALWNIEKRYLMPYFAEHDRPVIWDIGCGPGHYCELFREAFGQGHAYHGIDKNIDFLALARNNYAANNRSFHNIDILKDKIGLPKPDIIFLRLILMHLTPADTHSLLAKCKKHLKKNGRIIVLDTDDGYFCLYPEPHLFDSLKSVKLLSQQRLGGDRLVGRKIYRLLRCTGFRDTRVHPHLFSTQELGNKVFSEFIFPIFQLQMDKTLVSARQINRGMRNLKKWAANKNNFGTAVEYIYVAGK